MRESQFNALADALFLAIEAAVDVSAADLDCERGDGVLTITCDDNGSKLILSRQPALAQVWLAARAGGFHFELCDGAWIDTVTGEPLRALLNRVCGMQAGASINLEF